MALSRLLFKLFHRFSITKQGKKMYHQSEPLRSNQLEKCYLSWTGMTIYQPLFALVNTLFLAVISPFIETKCISRRNQENNAL